jgi:hypothetical protein
METSDIESVHADLVDWGIVEPDAPVRLTRRFRGGLMRAAAMLQDEEKSGNKRPGSPVETMVTEALKAYPLPPGASASEAHRRFLVAVQLASLPEAVRKFVGEPG